VVEQELTCASASARTKQHCPAFRHTLPMSLTNRLLFTPSWTFFAKYYYPLATRYFSGDDLVFINFGYEEAPPMGLPLLHSALPPHGDPHLGIRRPI
jgi:hypothetical protein